MDAIGLDAWLLANRLVWPALLVGVPTVVGGEFAAVLQGVPIEEPEMVLHLRLTDLDAFHEVVRIARCSLGVLEASFDPLEPEENTEGSELAVVAMVGTIRVLLVSELPVAKVISVERQFDRGHDPDRRAGCSLEVLRESGMLEPAAVALAQRLLQRATG